MDYKRIELKNGAGLNIISTGKFKTGFLSLNFIRPLSRGENAKNALLVQVLRRGCEGLETQQKINAELSKNYGMRLEPIVRKRGECQVFGFYCTMINNSFAFEGENIFKNAVTIMEKLMFEPLIADGAFLEEYVESEKRNLKNYIAAQINDKISYSIKRASEEMCACEPYALSAYGEAEDVDGITPRELYEHYRLIIKEAKTEAFYVGSEDEDTLKAAFVHLRALSKRPADTLPKPVVTGDVKEVRRVTEELKVAQGKLAIGCRTGITEGDALYPALVLANALFGGTPVSKLFMNVREKLSLCYYVKSITDKLKGVMIIAAGIENENLDVTLKEIEAQLSALKRGEITEDELTAARAALRTSINSTLDSGAQTEDYYLTKTINGDTSSPLDLLLRLDAVTTDEIIAAANTIKYDTIYFLKGTEGGADDEQ
ncbi:MAG: insulinase family protein [Clostridia bacterium]|nr:insulinase family protein [Clostridia bacterium]